MDNQSLELVKHIASDIETNIYKESGFERVNTTLRFKTTQGLIDALRILKPLQFFFVNNRGKDHLIEFRSIAEAQKAAETLKERECLPLTTP